METTVQNQTQPTQIEDTYVDPAEALQDQLIALAEKADDEAYEKILTSTKAPFLKEQLDVAIIALCQRLFTLCAPILSPKPTTNPPNRLVEVMNALFVDPPTEKTTPLKAPADVLRHQIQWLRAKRLDFAVPGTIKQIAKAARDQYGSDATYIDVKEKASLAKSMQLALPSIHFPKTLEELTKGLQETKAIPSAERLPDPEGVGNWKNFVADAEEYFHIAPNEEMFSVDDYVDQLNDTLYYAQLVGYVAAGAQRVLRAKSTESVDLETGLNLAPIIIKPLAYRKDELLQTLLTPKEVLAEMQTQAELDAEDQKPKTELDIA